MGMVIMGEMRVVCTFPPLSEKEMAGLAALEGHLVRGGKVRQMVKGHVVTRRRGHPPVETFVPDWQEIHTVLP